MYLGHNKDTGIKYAIKEMDKDHLMRKQAGQGKNAYDCVMEELKVLQRLEHPNIIWLHEIINDPKKSKIYLVTEWQKKGSLASKVGKDMRLYFIDMLKALHYCHETAKVVHRDIKPDNIMINHNDEAVLIDFGVSEIVESSCIMESNLGSYMFFAPEMFNLASGAKVHGEKTDIWALGITFYFLMTGAYPWKNATNPMNLKEMVCSQEIDF